MIIAPAASAERLPSRNRKVNVEAAIRGAGRPVVPATCGLGFGQNGLRHISRLCVHLNRQFARKNAMQAA
ncbi:MAG: hypothetical protein JWM68_2381 [Verrucomicrobiales bacterium]|nr:hypothetical protein [Verrucomicrobiales bacterium]